MRKEKKMNKLEIRINWISLCVNNLEGRQEVKRSVIRYR